MPRRLCVIFDAATVSLLAETEVKANSTASVKDQICQTSSWQDENNAEKFIRIKWQDKQYLPCPITWTATRLPLERLQMMSLRLWNVPKIKLAVLFWVFLNNWHGLKKHLDTFFIAADYRNWALILFASLRFAHSDPLQFESPANIIVWRDCSDSRCWMFRACIDAKL